MFQSNKFLSNEIVETAVILVSRKTEGIEWLAHAEEAAQHCNLLKQRLLLKCVLVKRLLLHSLGLALLNFKILQALQLPFPGGLSTFLLFNRALLGFGANQSFLEVIVLDGDDFQDFSF